ncbi:MAG: tRNA (adenosine(37)-N6)-threonylcarbamoyltransferase complex ATPase subunit type 1 TsaE [Melioribacteraceae bacterium]|nr:tRNA (adenosine(37)-N6)-threonylcarbamoyltransferase complex ATPase subunit type 1 TsaE [Melioribacteraceae bacterium]
MKFPFKIVVESEDETLKVAAEFGELLKAADIIALTGNLGSGKTFFVKSVLKFLGIDEVTSPTFAIVNTYTGKVKINHFDFYRIKKLAELYDIGFEEYVNDASAITFIEWADMFTEILPKNIYQINITYLEESKREISIGIK